MEYLKETLTRSIGETESVTNAARRVTSPHIERTKRIKPIRIVTKPVSTARMIPTMPDIPVDRSSKAIPKK